MRIKLPVPTDDPYPYLNGATSGSTSDYGALGDITSQIAAGIQKGFADCIVWLIEKVTPLVCMCCKITIAGCIVVYFCSKDKRCVTAGVKDFILMLIFLLLDMFVHQ